MVFGLKYLLQISTVMKKTFDLSRTRSSRSYSLDMKLETYSDSEGLVEKPSHLSATLPIFRDGECRKSFSVVPQDVISRRESFVELEGPGRLGNVILALLRLVYFAEENCCHISLPPDVLPGLPPLAFRNENNCSADS